MNETAIEIFCAERNGGGEELFVKGSVMKESRRGVAATRIALAGPKCISGDESPGSELRYLSDVNGYE